MTKTEFLDALETKLTGEIPETVIRRNLSYYSDYIDSAIRSGKTEQEVLEELGSPVLIARTIIDTADGNENGSRFNRSYGDSTDQAESHSEHHSFHLEMKDKKTKWMFIGILILVVILLFTVLRLLLPFLLPLILVMVLIKLMNKDKDED